MVSKEYKRINKRLSNRVNNCIYMYNDYKVVCCEGGAPTAGCYHDHCTGVKKR